MIREFPYPFKRIFSIASDADFMDKQFLMNFHKCLNNYHGLFITNSFWFNTCTTDSSLAFTKSPNKFINNLNNLNSLDFNQLHNNSNIIIDYFHRGNLDHTHGWIDDNVFNIKIHPNNYSVYYNRYDIIVTFNKNLRCNGGEIKNTINILLNKNNVNTIKLLWNDKNIVYDKEIIKKNSYNTDKGLLISLLIENSAVIKKNNKIIINCKLNPGLKEISLEGFNNNICELNQKLIDIYKINCKYSTWHGGWTSSNKKLLKYHQYYGYKYIEYISELPIPIKNNDNNYTIKKDKCIRDGFIKREKNNNGFTDYSDLSNVQNIINKYHITNTNANGENIILILEYLLNIPNTLYKSIWYTHLGYIPSIKKMNTQKRVEPYPIEYEEYFKLLSDRYYNYSNHNLERIFVCGATFYCHYEKIKEELKDKITIKNNNIHINSWISPITNKKRLNGNQWSSDLSFITIYTPSLDSKLYINDEEKYNYIRNPKDEIGEYSITILDVTSKTTLLSYLPYDIEQKENCTIENENSFLLNKLIKVNKNGDSKTIINLHDIQSWNTSHLILDYESNFQNENTTFNIVIHSNWKKIALNGFHKDSDSYWNKSDEKDSIICLTTYNLNFTEKAINNYLNNNISKGLSLPIGNIHKIEVVIYNGNIGDTLKIKDLSCYKCNPNYILDRKYLISGIISSNNKKLNNVMVEIEFKDKKEKYKSGIINNRYYFHAINNAIYRINIYYNNDKVLTSKWKLLTKNESEINFKI